MRPYLLCLLTSSALRENYAIEHIPHYVDTPKKKQYYDELSKGNVLEINPRQPARAALKMISMMKLLTLQLSKTYGKMMEGTVGGPVTEGNQMC